MTITVYADEGGEVRVTQERVAARPPDEVAFTISGTVTVSGALLAQFEGTTAEPVQVEIGVDDARTATIDLRNGASLRLETVDVGLEIPGVDESGVPPERPGVVAFTVEGVISGVTAETLAEIEAGPATFESITFAVEDAIESDGGRRADAIAEFTLFGYGIVVLRDGTVTIGGAGTRLP